MNFVDDEDLVAVTCRIDAQAVDDGVANVVDTGMRGGIDLKNVQRTAFGDLNARRTRVLIVNAARRRGLAVRLVAVQSLCKKTRGRRLSYASRSGK